jgi:hypothetical protein
VLTKNAVFTLHMSIAAVCKKFVHTYLKTLASSLTTDIRNSFVESVMPQTSEYIMKEENLFCTSVCST